MICYIHCIYFSKCFELNKSVYWLIAIRCLLTLFDDYDVVIIQLWLCENFVDYEDAVDARQF